MNDIYSILAPVYDAINGEVDHEKWADFYEREIRRFESGQTSLILDLGCGTGSMTLALARRGYDMTGIDISPEMLNVARSRAEKERLSERILWLCQDMTDFELYGTVEAVVSCLDCVNHLLSRDEVRECFSLVHNYLSPNGLFLFDLNSPYKFRHIYGDRAYLFEEKDFFCTWQNAFREKSGICDFSISLFRREKDGRYTRFDEWQREKMYTPAAIERLLRETGFTLLSVAGDTDGNPPTEESHRLYFTARAVK